MDKFIARVQAALTFLLVGTWCLLVIVEVLGWGAVATMSADDMKEVVMLAVGFWLLRPRAAGVTTAEGEPKTPPATAGSAGPNWGGNVPGL